MTKNEKQKILNQHNYISDLEQLEMDTRDELGEMENA